MEYGVCRYPSELRGPYYKSIKPWQDLEIWT
jgi:hypothetical protein